MFLKFWTDCGVAVLDAKSAGVVMGTFVQEFHPVPLGGEWGGKMDCDHLQHGIPGRQPLPGAQITRPLNDMYVVLVEILQF